jgi:Leucine-rich repeat (LRR) protein
LPNLQGLELHNNAISSIEDGDFIGLSNLQSLQLQNNSISSIEAGDFAGLANLKWLALDGNSIASIESGAFVGLTNLEVIGLSYSSLSSIEAGVFDGLNVLEDLRINNSSLVSIQSGAFAGLTHLMTLDLRDNHITDLNLTAATFDNLQPATWNHNPINLLSGFAADSDEITSLVLDEARLSLNSLAAIVGQTTSITDVSLIGLTLTDEYPNDLSALLGIASLDNVRVDPSLYKMYAAEFAAFAALPGNTVTIVPEPTGTIILLGILGIVAAIRVSVPRRSH